MLEGIASVEPRSRDEPRTREDPLSRVVPELEPKGRVREEEREDFRRGGSGLPGIPGDPGVVVLEAAAGAGTSMLDLVEFLLKAFGINDRAALLAVLSMLDLGLSFALTAPEVELTLAMLVLDELRLSAFERLMLVRELVRFSEAVSVSLALALSLRSLDSGLGDAEANGLGDGLGEAEAVAVVEGLDGVVTLAALPMRESQPDFLAGVVSAICPIVRFCRCRC